MTTTNKRGLSLMRTLTLAHPLLIKGSSSYNQHMKANIPLISNLRKQWIIIHTIILFFFFNIMKFYYYYQRTSCGNQRHTNYLTFLIHFFFLKIS